MSFRGRLALATGIAVCLAIALASAAVYLIVRSELRGQVDDDLRRLAGGVFTIRVKGDRMLQAGLGAPGAAREPVVIVDGRRMPLGEYMRRQLRELRRRGGAESGKGEEDPLRVALPRDALGSQVGYAQFVDVDGEVIGPAADELGPRLEVTPRTIAVARGEADAFFQDTEVDGDHVRVYTRNVGGDRAVQAARSLAEVDDTLDRLALVLVGVSVGGIGLAVGLGLLVGRTAVRPVERLTEAAEHVATTRDLSRRIEAGGRDELARLARSFNTMLAALERSLAAQRQLVADASHELRTPLTSLRTNVEVLAGAERLDAEERRQLLADVGAQLEELSELVADLVELAREEEHAGEQEELRFDELVAAAIERARRHAPSVRFLADLRPCLVRANPARLDRAVANLLDNAGKWSPAGGAVEVRLRDGLLTVRDHGPGFDPGELERVFDRFYRSPAARGRPGSGLGLAIVRQVAETHAGEASAANAPGGGGLLRLRLPCVARVSSYSPVG